jgi:hypothetical protein
MPQRESESDARREPPGSLLRFLPYLIRESVRTREIGEESLQEWAGRAAREDLAAHSLLGGEACEAEC